MEPYVYVVFSSTPYRIGKMIRCFTGESYNHVSISLDRELAQMYSFARRFYRTPFYGGFVRESKARYSPKGIPSQIKICRLQVSAEAYAQLEARLNAMYNRREQLLYNHLSIFTIPFRRLFLVKDAHVCSEFVAQQLHLLGMPLNPRKYYSVGTLEKLLEEHVIYTGDAPQADTADDPFFARHPVPCFTTLRSFGKLLCRIGK